MDGRAPRGPRRAVRGTRQSARGTWGGRRRGCGGFWRALASSQDAPGVGAVWPSRLALRGMILDTQIDQLAGWVWTHPESWTRPKVLSWRAHFWRHPLGQLVDSFLGHPLSRPVGGVSLDTPKLASWWDWVGHTLN